LIDKDATRHAAWPAAFERPEQDIAAFGLRQGLIVIKKSGPSAKI